MEIWTQLAAAAGVLALLLLMVAALGRKRLPLPGFGLATRNRRIEVLERRAVSPQASLVLVRVEGREWMLAVSPAGVQVLEKAAGVTPCAS